MLASMKAHGMVILTAITLTLGVGCGSSGAGGDAAAPSPPAQTSPSGSASPTSSPSPSSSEVDRAVAVVGQVFSVSGVTCPPSPSDPPTTQGRLGHCPLTSRLKAAVVGNPFKTGDALCRCAGPYGSRTVEARGATIPLVVRVTMDFGLSKTKVLEAVLVSAHEGWLVDDILCAGGDPSTSIYAGKPPLCD